jgi:hypothetical protein
MEVIKSCLCSNLHNHSASICIIMSLLTFASPSKPKEQNDRSKSNQAAGDGTTQEGMIGGDHGGETHRITHNKLNGERTRDQKKKRKTSPCTDEIGPALASAWACTTAGSTSPLTAWVLPPRIHFLASRSVNHTDAHPTVVMIQALCTTPLAFDSSSHLAGSTPPSTVMAISGGREGVHDGGYIGQGDSRLEPSHRAGTRTQARGDDGQEQPGDGGGGKKEDLGTAGDLARLAVAAHSVRECQQPPARGRVGARAAVLAGGVELVEEALRGGDGAGGEQAAEQEREGVRR